ncbi:MAG TPA: hypothetical protein VGE46_02965 [Bdellovibrio sp.]
MIRIYLSLLCLVVSVSAAAQQNRAKLKPLYFQADKNNLQVLPQRFEYTLLDEDRLKVGDILIEASQITFHVEPSSRIKGTYNIRFTWPAGLLKEGAISIKNNSGKAVLNSVITPENIKVSQEAPQDGEEEKLRSEVATINFDGISSSIIDDMKYFPFMVFCIYKESDDTRLYLCSKELYLSSQQGQMVVMPRSATKKPAQIEINGKIVGNQGIIYLDDKSENVAFKAQTQTGAFLEVETSKKDVDFKDVVVSEDGEKIILTASGAEPVDEKKVKKISEQEWQIALPKARPVLYLKGNGDIPMRQEFYVRGPLPKEKNRPFLSARSAERTYSSKLSFSGVTPEGTQVKVDEKDSQASLEATKKNQFLWTVQDIPAGVENRRYLNVLSEGQNFSVGYDMFRGLPFGVGLGAQYLTPSGVAFGSVSFDWWVENFLGMNANWSRFHWGLSLSRDQQLTESDGVAKVDITTFELLWRNQDGFDLIDETWGLSLPLKMIQGPSASAMTYGLGGFVSKKPMRWLKSFMHWSELELQYFLGSSGSDFKVKSAYMLSAKAFWKVSARTHWYYGLSLSDYKYDPAAPKENLQISLNGGIYWKF